MSTLRALVVCTGNTCRSPMAEAILRQRLADAGVGAEVRSAGTLGWSDRPATPHAVTVMHEMGLDLRGHMSRRLDPDDLDVDLVIAMTRVHAGSVIARDGDLRTRVFLPAEFARLAAAVTTAGEEAWSTRIRRVGEQRDEKLVGRPPEEVADPAGEPLDAYRVTAWRLDRDLTGLVGALTS